MSNKAFCINCGKIGHTNRKCDEPVTSLGVIAFKWFDVPKIIMIRRRNSLSYVEFLRGKFKETNTNYIIDLLNEMADYEIEDLKTKDFNTLWSELWMENHDKFYKNEFINIRNKIESLDIHALIAKRTGNHAEPEWGFPKGRRNYRENNIDCAMREFSEETGIKKSDICIIKNLKPIEELYLANNGIRYRHNYYFSILKDHDILTINPENKEQCSEVGDIGWFSKEECLEKLRNQDIYKKTIAERVFKFLDSVKEKNIISFYI